MGYFNNFLATFYVSTIIGCMITTALTLRDGKYDPSEPLKVSKEICKGTHCKLKLSNYQPFIMHKYNIGICVSKTGENKILSAGDPILYKVGKGGNKEYFSFKDNKITRIDIRGANDISACYTDIYHIPKETDFFPNISFDISQCEEIYSRNPLDNPRITPVFSDISEIIRDDIAGIIDFWLGNHLEVFREFTGDQLEEFSRNVIDIMVETQLGDANLYRDAPNIISRRVHALCASRYSNQINFRNQQTKRIFKEAIRELCSYI